MNAQRNRNACRGHRIARLDRRPAARCVLAFILIAAILPGRTSELLSSRASAAGSTGDADIAIAQTYAVETSRAVVRFREARASGAHTADDLAQNEAPGRPGNASGSVPTLPSLVRIVHLTEEVLPDKARDRREEGSAVVIGGRRLLTHGHYSSLGDANLRSEFLLLTVSCKGFLNDVRIPMRSVTIAYADAGTTILAIPGFVPLPKEVARLGDPALLEAGDPVTIHYWDDVEERFATLETTIVHMTGSVARIADPEVVINPGDSGSPAFDSRGELIGNVWSIVYHSSGVRLPYAQLALLPPAVSSDAN